MILDTERAFQGNAIWGQGRWYLLVLASAFCYAHFDQVKALIVTFKFFTSFLRHPNGFRRLFR